MNKPLFLKQLEEKIFSSLSFKHLGSLHNPLSHGNWSKGPGMYGGADKGKAGGADVILGSPPPLAAQARSRLRARLRTAGVRRGVMKRPARKYAAPVGIPRPLGGGRGIAKPPESGGRGGVKRRRFAPKSPDQQTGGNKPKRPTQGPKPKGRRYPIVGEFTSNVERNAARKQRMRDLVKKRIIKTIETANNGGIPPNAPTTVVPQKYPIVPVGPPTSGKPPAGKKPSAGKKPKRPRNVKPGKGPSGPNQFVIPKPPSGGRKPKPVRPFQPPVVVPPTPGGIIPGRPGGSQYPVPGRPPRTPRFPLKPRPRPNPSDDVVEGDWRVLPKSRFGFNANTLRQVFAGALLLGGLGLAAGGVGAVGGAVGGAAGAVGDFLGIGPEAAAEREAEKKRKAAAGLPTVTKEIRGVVASNITRLLYLHKNDL